jgi:hypothetical protein
MIGRKVTPGSFAANCEKREKIFLTCYEKRKATSKRRPLPQQIARAQPTKDLRRNNLGGCSLLSAKEELFAGLEKSLSGYWNPVWVVRISQIPQRHSSHQANRYTRGRGQLSS